MISETKIYDRSGEVYILERITEDRFHVLHHGVRVGHLYCQKAGKSVEITDLVISDCVLNKGNEFMKFLRLIPQTTSYQEKGVGTALLYFASEHYKALGCERIVGKIVSIDLDERPWLPGWYRKHGFIVPEAGIGRIWKQVI